MTREYYPRPEQTALAKIREGDPIAHRMGDVGFFDPLGRLWMCGRKSHRVATSERGKQQPVVLSELRALAGRAPITASLEPFAIFPGIFPGTFPVDARHNAKIEREKLARWAQQLAAPY